jgi:hypothetical protein
MSKKDNDDTAASGSMMESVLAIAMGTEEKRYGLLAEHVLSRIGPVLSLHATLFPEDFRTESDVRELNGTFDRNDLALPWGAKDLCHWIPPLGTIHGKNHGNDLLTFFSLLPSPDTIFSSRFPIPTHPRSSTFNILHQIPQLHHRHPHPHHLMISTMTMIQLQQIPKL